MVVYASNAKTHRQEAGGSETQSQHWLHRKSELSLDSHDLALKRERGRAEGGKEEKGMPGRERRNEDKNSTLCIPGTFQKKLHALRQKKWLMG